MTVRPEDFIDRVNDELSFIEFLGLLSADWEASAEIEREKPSAPYGALALGWQNGSIGSFLEAASACGFDSLPRGGIMPDTNPWRVAAALMLAGKYYE